ncbi:MAG: hypothetical protein PVJ39_04770 [Gammaproteobacteria bacterium]|jgi:hypothetical protein
MTTTGRKFYVVKWLLRMWFINFAALVVLGVLEIPNIPQALGLSLGAITAGIVGYIGVNVWQKKIQSDDGPVYRKGGA